ncbi:class I adenylate-forming enzyme family protein [Mycolicibacterium aichiense]|uniref:Long-chain-fatty-acid--CoA ligase FadD13 n=2 Tax=Mycolicibacterium TaxID=1866885 RepID=A0AAD1HQP7_9MYCO|nr:AMP-binding protein [Mycolicibacterium aichiense]MCV7019366.1 AMP-binding protein [Mycolicibacterium aichiense]BBX09281.1 long-chain-fatty-acid--CoA ligase FadD13 [Mycolicibacterium aichiense]SUA13849.1 chain-fatty-acid-CoA ligase [Mycolicibacterium aichiense]
MSGTVVDALAFWARTKPAATAIDFDGDTVSYAELARWADGVGHVLLDRGVRPGDRVSFVGVNSLEWCAAALGALVVGAIAAPFNNRMVARELADLVHDCQPSVVFCDEALLPRLDDVHAQDPSFEIAVFERDVRSLRHSCPTPVRRPVMDTNMPTAIVFTSGSTGRPKGVIFTHDTIAGVAHEWSLLEPVSGRDLRPLMVLPLFSAAGIIWGIARTVLNGGTLYLQPRFDPVRALEVLIRDKPNTLTGPPILFEQIAGVDGFDDADLSHLSTAHVGGARVSVELLARWAPRGVALRQLYGQTEIGGTASVTPLEEAAHGAETCGRGGIFTKIRVVDADGVDCPPHVTGEILLRGPGMMPGYWRNEEATRAALVDGWLRTGDLGMLDERGYLTFVDRLKDMIISGGLNISPAEVEAVIATMPGIEEVAVISVPDKKFGETAAALIRASRPLDESDVVQFCNQRLADYKVPRYVVLCEEPLPRLASGKIAKPLLRSTYAQIPGSYARVR